MPIDESQPAARPPASGGDHPGFARPAPALAKAPAMPGGVPPMFANPIGRPAPHSDARGH